MKEPVLNEKTAPLAGMLGILGSFGVGACCVLPLLFVTMGLGGSWLVHVTALAPLQPLFLMLSIAAIGFGFWRVFRSPQKNCADKLCTSQASKKTSLVILGIASILTLGFWLFPFLYF